MPATATINTMKPMMKAISVGLLYLIMPFSKVSLLMEKPSMAPWCLFSLRLSFFSLRE
jgi:hypothetical protein